MTAFRPIGHAPVDVPLEEPPTLLVVVDTEEEFDWNAPFDRAQTHVRAMAEVGRGQELFEEFGVRPVYVVDWPVASQEQGYRDLVAYAREGRAVIGAHLHPWVTPPHEETVNPRNSYPGNLPRALEQEKLRQLSAQIHETFGERPVVYKAGRYGHGPHTASILEEEGFEVDCSVSPPFDYRGDHGPDYTDWTPEPYWFGGQRRLLGLPTTGAYVGWWPGNAHRLHALGQRLVRARMPGILSRLGAVDRLRLSPEGFALQDLKTLTRALLRQGLRTFTLSLHSPSLAPGHTEFVRTKADRERFLGTCRSFLQFFFQECGGQAGTPMELKARYARWSKNAGSGTTAGPSPSTPTDPS